MRGRSVTLVFCLAAGAASCVESREAPPISDQALISYGPRIYLVDNTRSQGRNAQTPCTRLGTTATSTEALRSTDGIAELIDPLTPHNCFVQVAPKQLGVDVVEVTNELYQLCVDSGVCDTPDPSKGEKAQFCQEEDRFDVCPVLEVPQGQAQKFCAWTGRRLPSMIESIAIRQAAMSNQDQTQLTPFPTGEMPPDNCDDAVTAGGKCLASRPRPVLDDGGQPKGGGTRDLVETDKKIFDLMGNAAEWTNDRMSAQRGNAEDLPWFCIAALPGTSTTSTTTVTAPECPDGLEGLVCVYAQYKLAEDEPIGIYPLCLTTENGSFSGDIGVLAGGSYRDNASNTNDARDYFGVYSRRLQPEPDELTDGSLARQYGFRCVDNRESAMGDGDVPPFTAELEIQRLP